MPVRYKAFYRSVLSESETAEVEVVDQLAQAFIAHLTANEAGIAEVNVPMAQSKVVQDIVHTLLVDEWRSWTERPLNLDDVRLISRVRPDFFIRLGDDRGILVEVEKGGAVNNNHDLKDMWKAHLARNAHHLFLAVPNRNRTKLGLPREQPFRRVVSRIGLFFDDPIREVKVDSAHIFGYGSD